jgi:hypothetical protein
MNRGSVTADKRAAQAALARPEQFDRYLLVDDTDDDATVIQTVLRQRQPRLMEPAP